MYDYYSHDKNVPSIAGSAIQEQVKQTPLQQAIARTGSQIQETESLISQLQLALEPVLSEPVPRASVAESLNACREAIRHSPLINEIGAMHGMVELQNDRLRDILERLTV
jgi:hypothetical protein